MNKAVGKRILAAVLCVCMLAGLGHVSSLRVKAESLNGGRIELASAGTGYSGKEINLSDLVSKIFIKNDDGSETEVADKSQYTIKADKDGQIFTGSIKDSGNYTIYAEASDSSKTAGLMYSITPWDLTSAVRAGVTFNMKEIERGTSDITIDDLMELYLEDPTSGKLVGMEELAYNNDLASGTVHPEVDYVYTISADRVTLKGRNNYNSDARTVEGIINWKSKTFNITYNDLINFGSETKVDVRVTDKNGTALVEGTDYTIMYRGEDGYSRPEADIYQAAGTYSFIVTGTPTGDYRGESETREFIVQKQLSAVTIPQSPDVTYNGKEHTPKLTITDNGKTLVEGTDYTLSYANNTTFGTAQIFIDGTGAYAGRVIRTFNIQKLNLNSGVTIKQVDGETLKYDGNVQIPNVTVSYGDTVFENVTWNVRPFNDVEDVISARTNVRYIVTTTDNNFEGQGEVSCTILPRELKEEGFTINYVAGTESDYTGDNWNPNVSSIIDIGLGNKPLEADKDYIVVAGNTSDANPSGETYELQIRGQGNYTGTVTQSYKINPIDISGGTGVSPVTIRFIDEDLVYTGSEQRPRIEVFYGARVLEEGRDYSVEYADNVNAGTGNVRITGRGNYINTTNATFEIAKKDISDTSRVIVTPEYTELEFVYTGITRTPKIAVSYNGQELSEASGDFSISTPVGATLDLVTGRDIELTVRGGGTNYTGERTVKYKIIPRKLTDNNLKIATDMTGNVEAAGTELRYKGDGQEVRFDNLYLWCDAEGDGTWRTMSAADFDIVYNDDNKDLGSATVTIKGKGNYDSGTSVTIPFYIKGDISQTTGNERLQVEIDEMPFTGSDIRLTEDNVTLTYLYGTEQHELKWGDDFEIEYLTTEGSAQDYTNVGTPQIKINSKGDYYQGSLTTTFTIIKRNLKDAFEENPSQLDIAIQPIVYTGRPMNINAVINGTTIKYNGIVDLNSDTVNLDYTVEFAQENVTDAGEVKVLIKALDSSRNFTGEVEVADKFVIEKREIVPADVENGIITSVINGGEKLVLIEQDYIRLYEQDMDLTYKNDAENLHFVDAKNTEDEKPKFTYQVTDRGYKDFKDIGKDTITIEGTGNFKGEVDIPVEIWGDFAEAEGKTYKSDNGQAPVLDIVYEELQNFAEGEINPEVVVTYRGKELAQTAAEGEAKGYSVAYTGDLENVTPADVEEADIPTLTITGTGYYLPTEVSRTFRIQKCDLGTAYQEDEEGNPIGSITVTGYNGTPGLENEAVIYNKSEWRPLSGIYNNERPVGQTWADIPQDAWENPEYFTIEYANNIQGGAKDKVGGPSVTIKATENNPNYQGSVTIHFTIFGRNLESEFNKEIDPIENLIFDGEGQRPIPVIRVEARRPIDDEDRETVTLLYGEDFLLEYENNVNAGENTAIAKIIGINNYSGTVTTNFTIEPKSIDSTAVAIRDYTLSIEESKYTGSQITPKVTIIDNRRVILEELSAPGLLAMLGARAMGVELVEGTDFTVTPANTNINVGAAAVTIEGIGNYTGKLENEPFDIIPLPWDDESIAVAEIVPQTYTGTEIKPTVAVTMNNIPLTEGVDFEVVAASGFDNVNVPSGKLTITSTADNYNLTGFQDVDFNIVPKDLGDRDIVIEDIENQALIGGKAEPRLVVQYVKGGEEAPITLVEGTDYTVSYDGNTETGTRATATITGIEGGNYTGTQTALFTIAANIDDAELKEAVPAQEYTGAPIEPKFELVLNNRTLREGADYTVKYLNNIEAGEATIIVQGAMAFGGTKEIHFNITRNVAELIGVDGLAENYLFTGHPIEPSLGKVALNLGEDNEIVLEKDKDYTLSFENNTAVGEATMTVNGAGVYAGSKSFNFNITHKSVAQCTVSGVRPMTYDGKPQKPTISVLDAGNGVQLQAGTDYNVVYLNNNRPGEARVIVSGKGNYTGNQVLTYKINLPNVSGVGAVANSSKKATLTWTLGTAVTGYEIYDSDNVLVSRNNRASYIVYGLTPETEYGYKVRSYVIVGGQIFYSGFTNVSVRTN